MAGLLENAQSMLPGERVRYAFTGQTGLHPRWRFLSFWLIVANKPRVVAVTDDAVVVMRAGQWRWARQRPREVLYRLARQTVIGPLSRGGWSKVRLGHEAIWVSRLAYGVIEKANAELQPPPPPPG